MSAGFCIEPRGERAKQARLEGHLRRGKPASAIRLDKPERVSARHLTKEGEAREAQEFPLTREVGNAITRYVREVPPKCEHWEVFITHRGPSAYMHHPF
jgi:hypothetical protein